MCGVIGVIGSPEAAKETFLGLITLQHRGQDAAGILSYDRSFHEVKNIGLVESVFTRESVEGLKGEMAVGHNRYSTVGRGDLREVQPLTLNYPYGLGVVHNGNIVNYLQVKDRLKTEFRRLCFSNSDTETILNWIAHDLSRTTAADGSADDTGSAAVLNFGAGLEFDRLKSAVSSIFENIHGSYSIVGLVGGSGNGATPSGGSGGLFAFRDPNGIRPLVLGRKEIAGKQAYMVASESVSLEVNGYLVERDLNPGELIFIESDDGTLKVRSANISFKALRPCMFEWVYFASAESELERTPVYGARLALGRALASVVRERIASGDIQADLVAPVPDTSRTAASALAESLGLPYREVLIKNRYIKRTFILSTQQQRQRSVDLKLNPVVSEIVGKNIILVDDSIVRGTTSRKIVDLVKRAGAKKVYFLSTCPPIRFPCFYGIDFPDQTELIAAGKTESEIAKILGADGVFYQKYSGLIDSLKEASGGHVTNPCTACLNGEYPTDVTQSQRFTQMRIDERSE